MTPLDPDQAVLTSVFSTFKANNYPDMSEGAAFEIFVAGELMKQYDFTDAEIRKGIVGESLDGGIDAFYVVINKNELLDIDSAVTLGRKKAVQTQPNGVVVDVVVIQSKWNNSWQTDPLSRLRDTLQQLLDRTANVKALESIYNSEVLERTGIFRSAYASLLDRLPEFRVRIAYVTRGSDVNLADAGQVKNKSALLVDAVKKLLPSNAEVTVELVGATRLTEIMRSTPNEVAKLRFSQSPIREAHSFVGLVRISDYLSFVRRTSKDIRPGIFESNVRDFAGPVVSVNASIRATAERADEVQFWWVNNGVTVLADQAQDDPPLGLTLVNPLIVNGLQTTHVLHETELTGDIPPERLEQSVLVRIITDAETSTRDLVIAGTNRQTAISPIQLHATELLHRQLEEFLVTVNWYYERRKHQYRGTQKPANRVVGIGELAQAMIAIALVRPDDARARPSTLLSDPKTYKDVFPDEMPRPAYATALDLMYSVDAYLRTPAATAILYAPTNIRYYLAVGYVMKTLRVKKISSIKFAVNYPRIATSVDSARLELVHIMLRKTLEDFQKRNPLLTLDQIFKGKGFKVEFFEALK